jgi:hypothetical protein
MVFYPSKFWHTADWESSSSRPRDGYIEDTVLYAGDFDEVNIHLHPRVRTVRVCAVDAGVTRLQSLGMTGRDGVTAHIFVPRSRMDEVESFRPTVFAFEPQGFTNVRRGEYVSWQPQTAISVETIPMQIARARWNLEVCYVDDLDPVIRTLSNAGIYFDEQT